MRFLLIWICLEFNKWEPDVENDWETTGSGTVQVRRHSRETAASDPVLFWGYPNVTDATAVLEGLVQAVGEPASESECRVGCSAETVQAPVGSDKEQAIVR